MDLAKYLKWLKNEKKNIPIIFVILLFQIFEKSNTHTHTHMPILLRSDEIGEQIVDEK